MRSRLLAPLAFVASLVAIVVLIGTWPASDLSAQGYSNTNPYAYWVPPGACAARTSGSTTGTQGLTVAGASFTPVMQVQTSAGAATDTFVCNITPPNTIITTGNGILITDAVFMYAPTTAGLNPQSATLASGTMNSATVFSYIEYPTAGASETPSAVTPVRADSGTLTIAPAVASFNVGTITAGRFYSVKFTPAAGTLAFKTDLRQLLLTVALVTDAAANVVNSSGVLVHFRGQ